MLIRTAKNGTNPVGSSGFITTCDHCVSLLHWRKNCPESQKPKKLTGAVETNYIVSASMSNCFPTETEHLGIVDTGCTMSIAGFTWYSKYKSKLPKELEVSEDRN